VTCHGHCTGAGPETPPRPHIAPCPFAEVTARRYRTIVADPPWPYETSKSGRFAMPKPEKDIGQLGVESMGYGVMEVAELCALQPPADDAAHLYLWTTNAFMVEAHQIARAWGFRPKTILTWTKTYQDNPSRVSMKTGYYFRGATEHCLFSVRGSLKLQVSEGLPTAYLWPRLPHSVKPDAFYDLVERASPGPYLELFARRARFGWDYWGDESLQTVELAS
jgi:N6-adenosine-specific RNA methylase IME4